MHQYQNCWGWDESFLLKHVNLNVRSRGQNQGLVTIIQKWNTKWKKLCCLYCLSELAVLKLIFYSYNSVSDLRFSLVVEQCNNSKQVCCRKTIETTQFFSLSVSLLYHSARPMVHKGNFIYSVKSQQVIPKLPFELS